MKKTQELTDKLAIALSLACAIHCLVLPVLLVMMPSLAILNLDNEDYHFWMVLVVIPSSIYALMLGCKKHKRYRLLVLGSIGLTLLVSAVALGEENIGEMGEKLMTLAGAGFIAVGHWLNFRLCREQSEERCPCPG